MSSDVLTRLTEAEKSFKKACDQIIQLNRRLDDMAKRYDKASRENHRSFRYSLRLRMAVTEGVRNMYYEYAATKADEITNLRCEVGGEGAAGNDSGEAPDRNNVEEDGDADGDADEADGGSGADDGGGGDGAEEDQAVAEGDNDNNADNVNNDHQEESDEDGYGYYDDHDLEQHDAETDVEQHDAETDVEQHDAETETGMQVDGDDVSVAANPIEDSRVINSSNIDLDLPNRLMPSHYEEFDIVSDSDEEDQAVQAAALGEQQWQIVAGTSAEADSVHESSGSSDGQASRLLIRLRPAFTTARPSPGSSGTSSSLSLTSSQSDSS